MRFHHMPQLELAVMGGSLRAFEPCITHVEQLHLKVSCLVFDIRFADLVHHLLEIPNRAQSE